VSGPQRCHVSKSLVTARLVVVRFSRNFTGNSLGQFGGRRGLPSISQYWPAGYARDA
jgi:hypothetical protein